MDHLQGIRIVSFNHFLMGPLGVQFLADLGADVVAIEPIEGGFQRKWKGADKDVDGQSMLHLMGNRNKRSMALNLKSSEGVAVARRLAATADVVAENFRPGVMDKLGLGFNQLREIRPQLIYAAASGFGQNGPYAQRPGQDLIIQAMSGLANINGSREHGPRAMGVSAADHHGAALFAAGILAAIVRRERTGEGGRVDVDLLSAALDLQMESLVCFLNGDRSEDTRPVGQIATWYHGAPYGVYATGDGFLAISVAPLDVLSEILGISAQERIPPADAYRRREEASLAIARELRKRTTAQWSETFRQRGIWHAPVNDYRQLAEDPQVAHNGSIVTLPGCSGAPITLVSHPVRYDGRVPPVRLPPQPLGAQSTDILAELGYGAEEARRLIGAGIVGALSTGGDA
ncbi:MAG TPA: CaiB/BaiF CoA-transferase family protein [Roseiarcus sp.]|nr:CaiB/BaiF CoA-transferase family protein [Roseiarcus sp.]